MNMPVRMGMVGGGEGSFIGVIHRMAAALDGNIELVAGCFSQDTVRNRQSGVQLGLSESRIYNSYDEMMKAEAELPETIRMQFVAIVTPNHLHLPVALSALHWGFHVLSEKPAAANLEEILELKKAVENSGLLYGLTHTYIGYALVKQARTMICQGQLGEVRRVTVAYPQGWLASVGDSTASKQARWRLDPGRAGESGCFGDIGTHAHNLVEYITGLEVTEICADLRSVVDDRLLDDDGAAMFKLSNTARGVLTASQVCAGEGNNLNISVYAEKGSLFWQQQSPDRLQVRFNGQPEMIYKAGNNCEYLAPGVRAICRTPEGHPEGYIEAFANIYRGFAHSITNSEHCNIGPAITAKDSPINQGVRGMAFVRAAIESSRNNAAWVSLASALKAVQ